MDMQSTPTIGMSSLYPASIGLRHPQMPRTCPLEVGSGLPQRKTNFMAGRKMALTEGGSARVGRARDQSPSSRDLRSMRDPRIEERAAWISDIRFAEGNGRRGPEWPARASRARSVREAGESLRVDGIGVAPVRGSCREHSIQARLQLAERSLLFPVVCEQIDVRSEHLGHDLLASRLVLYPWAHVGVDATEAAVEGGGEVAMRRWIPAEHGIRIHRVPC